MLKIKDNIDLKELEKFGFKLKLDDNKSRYIEKNTLQYKLIIMCNTKQILVWSFGSYGEISNILYDLIKADLVEKVDENEH